MATHNDITGDALVSRTANNNYRDNYDAIFRKNRAQKVADNAGSKELLVETNPEEQDTPASTPTNT